MQPGRADIALAESSERQAYQSAINLVNTFALQASRNVLKNPCSGPLPAFSVATGSVEMVPNRVPPNVGPEVVATTTTPAVSAESDMLFIDRTLMPAREEIVLSELSERQAFSAALAIVNTVALLDSRDVLKTPGPGAQYASAVGLDPVVPRQLSDATTCTYDDILPYDSVTFDVRHFYFNVVGGCQRLSDEEWTRALPLLSMCATSGFAILPPTTVDEVVNDDEDDGDDDGAEEQVDTPESPLAPPHVPREPRSKDSPPVVEHATGTDAVGDEEEVEMEVESGAPLYNGLTKDKYISELVTHACADHLTKQEFSKRVDDLFACRCLFDYDSREHSELLAALDMAMSARYWRKRGIAPPSAGTDEESDREEEGDVVCDVEYVGGLGDY